MSGFDARWSSDLLIQHSSNHLKPVGISTRSPVYQVCPTGYPGSARGAGSSLPDVQMLPTLKLSKDLFEVPSPWDHTLTNWIESGSSTLLRNLDCLARRVCLCLYKSAASSLGFSPLQRQTYEASRTFATWAIALSSRTSSHQSEWLSAWSVGGPS